MGYVTEFLAHNFIFQPPNSNSHAASPKSANDVFLECALGNRIHTRLFTAFDDTCTLSKDNNGGEWDTSKTVVLFSHGNADDLRCIQTYCTWLAENLNVRIVSYDPPGYGFSSTVSTSEENMNSAINVVYQFLRVSLNQPSENIVLMGKSLGSVPTIDLSSRVLETLQGIILVSPLASGSRVLLSEKSLKFVPEWLKIQMDCCFAPNVYKISAITSPVLFIHGLDDHVVSVDNTYALSKALPVKYMFTPLFLTKAGHNNMEERYANQFIAACHDFIWQKSAASHYT